MKTSSFEKGKAEKPPKSKVKRAYILAPGQKLFFEPDPEDFVIHMKAPGKGGDE